MCDYVAPTADDLLLHERREHLSVSAAQDAEQARRRQLEYDNNKEFFETIGDDLMRPGDKIKQRAQRGRRSRPCTEVGTIDVATSNTDFLQAPPRDTANKFSGGRIAYHVGKVGGSMTAYTCMYPIALQLDNNPYGKEIKAELRKLV